MFSLVDGNRAPFAPTNDRVVERLRRKTGRQTCPDWGNRNRFGGLSRYWDRGQVKNSKPALITGGEACISIDMDDANYLKAWSL